VLALRTKLTDAVVMPRAYDWAFVNPIRKLYPNITMTLISISVAVFIGVMELLSLAGSALHRQGGMWRVIAALNDHLNEMGFAIVGVFVAVRGLSYLMYGFKRSGAPGTPIVKPDSSTAGRIASPVGQD
jgi:high-affinity nickel-transport protein